MHYTIFCLQAEVASVEPTKFLLFLLILVLDKKLCKIREKVALLKEKKKIQIFYLVEKNIGKDVVSVYFFIFLD